MHVGKYWYLYLDAGLDLLFAADKVQALGEHLHKADVLFGHDGTCGWGDTFVVRFLSTDTIEELDAKLRATLERFGSWALVSGGAEIRTSPGIKWAGFTDATKHNCLGQLFLMGGSTRSYDAVEARLGGAKASTSFRFAEGRIMAIWSPESAITIFRRCERELARFDQWVICDSQGETLGPVGHTDIWMPEDLSVFYFCDPEDA